MAEKGGGHEVAEESSSVSAFAAIDQLVLVVAVAQE